MSLDLFMKEASFYSGRPLEKAIVDQNAEKHRPQGAQPQLIHLQENSCIQETENLEEEGTERF